MYVFFCSDPRMASSRRVLGLGWGRVIGISGRKTSAGACLWTDDAGHAEPLSHSPYVLCRRPPKLDVQLRYEVDYTSDMKGYTN